MTGLGRGPRKLAAGSTEECPHCSSLSDVKNSDSCISLVTSDPLNVIVSNYLAVWLKLAPFMLGQYLSGKQVQSWHLTGLASSCPTQRKHFREEQQVANFVFGGQLRSNERLLLPTQTCIYTIRRLNQPCMPTWKTDPHQESIEFSVELHCRSDSKCVSAAM